MNVYRFELRLIWKSAAVWTAVLSALLIVLMQSVFPVYLESRAAIESALAGFPPEFSAAFGMEIANIFSYGGFYAFGFYYLSVLGAIMAASLGLDLFAREKRAKCTDFLLTKPVSRGRVFLSKYAAALTALAAANILFTAVSLALYRGAETGTKVYGHAALAALTLLLIQLTVLSVSVCIAVFAKKIRSVSGAATAIGFAGFILTALDNLIKEEALRYLDPYQYFDVTLAFSAGRYETRYILTAAAVTLTALALAFVRYSRSDAHAV